MFSDKYLKTKLKSYNNKITTKFKNVQNNSDKPQQEGSKEIYLPAIAIDSVLKVIQIVISHNKKDLRKFICQQ